MVFVRLSIKILRLLFYFLLNPVRKPRMGFSDPFIFGLEPLFQSVSPQDKVMWTVYVARPIRLEAGRTGRKKKIAYIIYDYDTSKAKARIRMSER